MTPSRLSSAAGLRSSRLPLTASCRALAALSLLGLLTTGTATAAPPAPTSPAASAAPSGLIELSAEQVRALGVATGPAGEEGAAAAVYPARVVVPPSQQRVVAAPLAGLVQTLSVSAGDAVKAGQTLAVLRSLSAQELQRDALQTRSQADLTRRAQERDELLFKEGLISAARLDSSRAAATQARAQDNERQRALALSGANSNGELVLRSPIDGVVLESMAAVGLRVEAAAALFRIASLGTLWLEVQVPARDAGALSLGDPVSVADHGPTGRLIAIGHAVDPTSQTVSLRAALSPQAGAVRVRPGQMVEARLEQRADGLIRVPEGALVQGPQGAMVFIEHSPGRYRPVPVQVRSTAGGTSAVAGLPAGSRVVVSGTAALRALLKS